MEDQWSVPAGDLATGLLFVALWRLTSGSTKATSEVTSILLGSAGWRKRKWRNIFWNIKILCLEFGLQNHKNMQNLHASKNFTSFVFISHPSSECCQDGIFIQECYLIPGSAWGDYEFLLLTLSLSGSWKHKRNIILCQLTKVVSCPILWLGWGWVCYLLLEKSKRITQEG